MDTIRQSFDNLMQEGASGAQFPIDWATSIIDADRGTEHVLSRMERRSDRMPATDTEAVSRHARIVAELVVRNIAAGPKSQLLQEIDEQMGAATRSINDALEGLPGNPKVEVNVAGMVNDYVSQSIRPMIDALAEAMTRGMLERHRRLDSTNVEYGEAVTRIAAAYDLGITIHRLVESGRIETLPVGGDLLWLVTDLRTGRTLVTARAGPIDLGKVRFSDGAVQLVMRHGRSALPEEFNDLFGTRLKIHAHGTVRGCDDEQTLARRMLTLLVAGREPASQGVSYIATPARSSSQPMRNEAGRPIEVHLTTSVEDAASGTFSTILSTRDRVVAQLAS